jgi:hypothetical protein
MLLTIFIFLTLFSLVLIIGGYYIEAPVMQIAGTGVLFITGILLLAANVEYVSGQNTATRFIYSNNLTGYHWDYDDADAPNFNPATLDDPSTVFLFHTDDNTTNVYSTWDEELLLGIQTRHTVAIVIMASAIFIFLSIMAHLKYGDGLDDEQ